MPFEEIQPNSERRWSEQRAAVERIRGALGNPVGEAVKDLVIGLNLFDIHTVYSGEGRMEDRRRATAPFIEIESKEAKELGDDYVRRNKDVGFNEPYAEDTRQKISEKNLKERAKLIPLLDEFYKERNTPYDARLIIESLKDNASRITNQGAQLQELASSHMRKQKLGEYQHEMQAFGVFLKQKFLSGK